MSTTDTACILVVDDHLSSLEMLKDILKRRRQHRVYTARSGSEALQLVAEIMPDLILLDVAMPGQGGFEVCEELKANDDTFEIPIIFISGLNDPEMITRGFELGAVDYITKPFNLREILARVDNQLTLVYQRRLLEEQHIHDLRSFEMLDKMKNQFIGNTVHDLKSPLNIILGYVDLLDKMDYGQSGTQAKNYLQGIRASVRMMRNLVTNMIDWAQIQRGGHLLRAISFSQFLANCLLDFNLLAAQRSIQLLLDTPEVDFVVRIDPDQMERAVYNLLSNALKYTPEGGRVILQGWQDGTGCVIQVRDTGIGIPPEAQPYIFDAFYRVNTQQHRVVEGTGLGLSIVKMVVEQHQGKLWVDSQQGQGSTFTISLPINGG